jgi:hypothetical protein
MGIGRAGCGDTEQSGPIRLIAKEKCQSCMGKQCEDVVGNTNVRSGVRHPPIRKAMPGFESSRKRGSLRRA